MLAQVVHLVLALLLHSELVLAVELLELLKVGVAGPPALALLALTVFEEHLKRAVALRFLCRLVAPSAAALVNLLGLNKRLLVFAAEPVYAVAARSEALVLLLLRPQDAGERTLLSRRVRLVARLGHALVAVASLLHYFFFLGIAAKRRNLSGGLLRRTVALLLEEGGKILLFEALEHLELALLVRARALGGLWGPALRGSLLVFLSSACCGRTVAVTCWRQLSVCGWRAIAVLPL